MKHVVVDVSTARPGQTVSVWWRNAHGGASGQGGTVAAVDEHVVTVNLPLGGSQSWPIADFDTGAAWVEVEVPFDEDECVTYGPECSGPVGMHSVGSSRSMPRCTACARHREKSYENSSERWADSDVAPSWFDPSYAGERWNEDD